MPDQGIKAVFGHQANSVQPFRRDPKGKEVIGLKATEQRRFHLLFDDLRDLPDRFSYLDDLGGAGFRMYFEAAALRPLVGFIVTVDVAHRHHVWRPMGNNPDAIADPKGPEVRILGFVNSLERESSLCWVHLELECRLLCQLCRRRVLSLQLLKRLLKCVGDGESHCATSNRGVSRTATAAGVEVGSAVTMFGPGPIPEVASTRTAWPVFVDHIIKARLPLTFPASIQSQSTSSGERSPARRSPCASGCHGESSSPKTSVHESLGGTSETICGDVYQVESSRMRCAASLPSKKRPMRKKCCRIASASVNCPN